MNEHLQITGAARGQTEAKEFIDFLRDYAGGHWLTSGANGNSVRIDLGAAVQPFELRFDDDWAFTVTYPLNKKNLEAVEHIVEALSEAAFTLRSLSVTIDHETILEYEGEGKRDVEPEISSQWSHGMRVFGQGYEFFLELHPRLYRSLTDQMRETFVTELGDTRLDEKGFYAGVDPYQPDDASTRYQIALIVLKPLRPDHCQALVESASLSIQRLIEMASLESPTGPPREPEEPGL